VRALVVYKKSQYELYESRTGIRALREQAHPFVRSMMLSHDANQRALSAVHRAFEAVGVVYDCIYRGELRSAEGYGLLCSVGGDGTFLEVARHSVSTPVLGVNSDPQRSIALFCTADQDTIQKRLEAALAGRLHEVRLARMRVAINGNPLDFYALNDLLFCHANPAAMSAYTLRLGDVKEAQKSSGVWFATAAGSTAAIRSAGGRRLPLRSRRLQYLVREPYVADGSPYRLGRGLVAPDAQVELTSKTRQGRLYIDGSHRYVPCGLGDMVQVSTAAPSLRVLGIDDARRRRF
jgi:NAD+ kinase